MAYFLDPGIWISLDNSTWHKLTDHNRQPIDVFPELIENVQRMANGKMRKYIVAQKNRISVSWQYVPSRTSECVDGHFGAAWLESFYKSNAGIPIYLKVISSEIDPDPSLNAAPSDLNFKTAKFGSKTYNVFMSNFNKTIINRTRLSDYVDMNIEFTEI